ncbi:Putative phage protein [Nitrosotalea sinensis]|uniref:Phage protein n=1 Tax=Nitrosotalea sinensis TaxID=1499975 RepID=A0A2H1EHV9_9ARCH|nr:zinc ribbon domain-containing protein [Candidatus Nitrosotalea sinensis]SHO45652.1 Putative phage protein [Candidatus Nitrosotalea sinensis]
MFCSKCGIQLPDDAVFCVKCGTKQSQASQPSPQNTQNVQTTTETKEVKCPSCGAPIVPKFGEMVVTCEYCGSSVSLENKGWQNVAKHSMLPLKISDRDQITETLHHMMDKGLLHRHLQENSKLEEIDLTMVPYWIIPVSARTNLVATDIAAEVGGIAATAAMAGLMGGAMSGGSRRGGGGFGGGMMDGMLFGTMMGGGGMMGGANATKAYTVDESYDCPVVAVKSLTAFQPHGYEFSLDVKVDFDPKKVPKGVKILNGDINDDAAKSLAKNIVDQIQSQMIHSKYHMIRQMQTDLEVSSGELLHVPIWFAQYDHKGKKIILIIDANSGNAINSIGL